MPIYFIKRGLKPNFWFFQISGWMGFGITDALISEYNFISFSLRNFIIWLVSLMLGFIISIGLRVYYKYFLRRNSGIFSIALLIVTGSVIAALLWQFAGDFIRKPFSSGEYLVSYIPGHLLQRIYMLIWPFFVWSILYFGLKFWIYMVEEKIRASRADADSRQAQLQMLRYQLNPHFLFNSLNSIQGLMYQDVARADLMLTELSEFLRYTLKFSSNIYIQLKDEFEIVEKFLTIEKIRFGDRLTFKITLPKELEDCKIIGLLIQPFVENAVKHGMKAKPFEKMMIIVTALKKDDWLHVIVQNTGGWIENGESNGTGISNARERLVNAYSSDCSLTITNNKTMVTVEIKIPYCE